jgi:branched-subunit amino acid aminotransferase/4-amino-4-deoxychorismate lyase
MMKSWLWTGGGFRAGATLPIPDRGFRYGMSVFESFPVRNGRPAFLMEHLARIETACERCGFGVSLPPLHRIERLFSRAAIDGFARIYVTAGDGSVTEPARNGRVLVLLESRAPVASRVYHRGYDLGIHPEPISTPFPGLKTGNYWGHLLAFQSGVRRQKNETLLINARGEIISAAMANLFAVRGNCLCTPALASGARDGVMREWVCRRRDVEEALLRRSDIEAATEIFLTSSWLGVMPVRSIEGRSIRLGTVSKSLLAEWRERDRGR